MILRLSLSLFVSVLALGAWVAHGHTSGASLEKQVGDYLIDIGYAPAELEVGAQIRFDTALYAGTERESVPFTDIWVQIRQDTEVLFAGGIARARIGPTGLLYVFPEDGSYELSVRFQNGTDTVAEATFPVTIVASSEDGAAAIPLSGVFVGLCGFVLGAVATTLARRISRA